MKSIALAALKLPLKASDHPAAESEPLFLLVLIA